MSRDKYIPYDLIINILSRLPSKSLLRFRRVCKSWRSLITGDSDVHTLHHQNANNSNNNDLRRWVCVHSTAFEPKYYQVFDETFSSGKLEPCPEPYPKDDERRWCYFEEVIGSCRGLVGVYHGWGQDTFGLWNPSTRTHKKLERLYIPEDSMADRCPRPFYYTLFGVGFSNKDNDYMVVVVARNRENNQDHRIYLYSLRDNSWSRIKAEPNSSWRNWNCLSSRGGTYYKGTCHWTCRGDTKGKVIILCFDFGSKKIWVMNVPPKSPNYAICKSFVHKDMLAYWETNCCVQGNSEYRFWVMKEYRSSNSWTILFRVEGGIFPHSNPRLDHFGTTADGRLVLYRSYLRDSNILMAYDPQTKEFKNFQVPNIFTLVSYQENLMLL